MTAPGRHPDPELRLWRHLAGRVPRLPRALGLVNHVFRRAYLRRRRDPVVVDVLGRPLTLDPHELVDGLMLFAPHLLDHRERRFLHRHLRPGDVFVDGGAYLGLYTLDLRRSARVIAVEAHPATAARLRRCVGDEVTVCAVALSNAVGHTHLSAAPVGNAGHRAVGDHGLRVPCTTLPALTAQLGVARVHAVKLDLEGHEDPVVGAALAAWPRAKWPTAWVIEAPTPGTTAAVERLRQAGYTITRLSRHNVGAHRPGAVDA